MFSTRNPWGCGIAGKLPSLQGSRPLAASPLVGEVGGGPAASAAEKESEDFLRRHLLWQMPRPTLPTRGRAPALLSALGPQRLMPSPLHAIAGPDSELRRTSAADFEHRGDRLSGGKLRFVERLRSGDPGDRAVRPDEDDVERDQRVLHPEGDVLRR